MKGYIPLKGMLFTVNDVLYVVSENAWSISEEFEYRNKENGKKYVSTVDKFNEGIDEGLIQLA